MYGSAGRLVHCAVTSTTKATDNDIITRSCSRVQHLLCSSWRPCRPLYRTTSWQPGILLCRFHSVEQLAVRHSNCFFCDNFQESTQDSFIYPVILHNTISSVRCCTLWTCYGAL